MEKKKSGLRLFVSRLKTSIKCTSNSAVIVSAHREVPEDVIINFVKEKLPDIKTTNLFKHAEPEHTHEKEYVSGETLYFGRQYRLKIVETDEKESVKLKNGYFMCT